MFEDELLESGIDSRLERKIKNPVEYVQELLQKGITPKLAVKDAPVEISLATQGQVVKTYTKDGLETVNIADEIDPYAHSIIVKGLDRDGNELLDKNGNPNVWLITMDYLLKNYSLTPKANERTVIEIPEDIEITAPWGEKQHLVSGSYLNISNPDDIYGIAAPEFNETYSILKNSIKAPKGYVK